MSEYHKYLFDKNPAEVAILPEYKGIYVDPTGNILASGTDLYTCGYSSALIPKTSILGTHSTYYQAKPFSIYGDILPPNANICVGSRPCDDYLSPNTNLYSSSVNAYKGLKHDNHFNGNAHGYYSTIGIVPETNLISGIGDHKGSCFMNTASALTQSNHVGTVPAYLVSNSNFINPGTNEGNINMPHTGSLYGTVLDTTSFYKVDTHIRPNSVHAYVDGTLCLKMFDNSELRMSYGGYSGHILKQTKDLFALNDQLSSLNAESKWLDSKINDEFYQSLYLPYGEELANYFESWSAQVKLKIQKVAAKVDRLFKYIVKLKIKAGTRRINKKRVFRTKVNLVFKNLDDAHPAELNYLNSVNALYLIFKHNKSWKLTFNT